MKIFDIWCIVNGEKLTGHFKFSLKNECDNICVLWIKNNSIKMNLPLGQEVGLCRHCSHACTNSLSESRDKKRSLYWCICTAQNYYWSFFKYSEMIRIGVTQPNPINNVLKNTSVTLKMIQIHYYNYTDVDYIGNKQELPRMTAQY